MTLKAKKIVVLLLVLAFVAALAAPAGAQVVKDYAEESYPGTDDSSAAVFGLKGPAKLPYVEVFLFGKPDPDFKWVPPLSEEYPGGDSASVQCSPANIVSAKPNPLGGHDYWIVYGQHLKITKPEWKAYVDKNGRTQFPVRFVSEALGYDVRWDGAQQKVTISKNGHTVEMFIGRKTYYVDGQPREMDTAPIVTQGRTFVPLRFAAEAMGCDVDWINTKHFVYISDFSTVVKDKVKACD